MTIPLEHMTSKNIVELHCMGRRVSPRVLSNQEGPRRAQVVGARPPLHQQPSSDPLLTSLANSASNLYDILRALDKVDTRLPRLS